MLNYFKNLSYTLITLLIVATIGGIGFVVFNNIKASNYTTDKVVAAYIKILDNPSKDAITGTEKEVLAEIVETGMIASWFNQAENQIKTLRYFKQGGPVNMRSIEFSGQDKEYATTFLGFNNDLKGEKSKSAKLYLQRQGSFVNGYRWRIYQIDLPEEQNPVTEIKNKGQDLLENLPTFSNPFK